MFRRGSPLPTGSVTALAILVLLAPIAARGSREGPALPGTTVLISLHGLGSSSEKADLDRPQMALEHVLERIDAARAGPCTTKAAKDLIWRSCTKAVHARQCSQVTAMPSCQAASGTEVGWINIGAGAVASFQAEVGGTAVLEGIARLHRDPEGRLSWLIVPAALLAAADLGPDESEGTNLWCLDDAQVRAHAASHLPGWEPNDAETGISRVWFLQDSRLHPVYALSGSLSLPPHDFLLLLDGETGTLVELRDLRLASTSQHRWSRQSRGRMGGLGIAAVQGRGLVFDPNPIVASGDRTLVEGDNVDLWRVEVPLDELDGTGFLRGPWADVTSLAGRAFRSDLRFFYSSQNLHFEEVMAYYHITEAQRYVQSLGFENLNARPQTVIVHATGFDDSWYSLLSRRIHLGDGGVDDGEDADIILHEYGHALHHAAVGGLGGGDTQAISEGLADYFAATRSGDPCVGDWDASGRASGCLRNLTEMRLYPVDLVGEPHEDGLIWGGLFWWIRERLGASLADRVVLQSMYYHTPLSSMEDAARGLLAAAAMIERTDGIEDLVAIAEEALIERGFLPRRGACTLMAGAGQLRHKIPIGFPFLGPGASEAGWCDTMLVGADGTFILQPGALARSAAAGPQHMDFLPMLAPVMAHPSPGGTWGYDSLEVRWEGTLWRMTADLRFHSGGAVVRRVAATLGADGEIEIAWLGDGDQTALDCLVGWFPSGAEGSVRWIDLPGEIEILPSSGEGVAAALPSEPFPLAGAIWQLVPDGDSGYRALLTRSPTPADPRLDHTLLAFPSPASAGGRIAFRVRCPDSYRLDLIDPSGRRLSHLLLGSLQPGLHEVSLSALAPDGRDLPSGVYFLRLKSHAETRVGRIILLR